jgi:hypothetical protein
MDEIGGKAEQLKRIKTFLFSSSEDGNSSLIVGQLFDGKV